MQKSGFFNALNNNGVYDRTYNANDYSDNLAVIISNGVLRSDNDDLRVTASGMVATVGVGRAWINGHYYYNDAPHSFAAVTAPSGGTRYDRVFLRLNTDIAARSIELVYRQGTAANSPVKPTPVREGNIYELVLADIFIGTNATSVIVTDTRADANLCGWVYSTSGDGSFFRTLDNNFNAWFNDTKNTLASVTLFKRYEWRTVLESAGKVFTFNVPQYDAETCFIEVYVNGLLVTNGSDYTLNGNIITFTDNLIADTEIEVKVFKSIDGTGIMSVADEITELQNAVASINTAENFFYSCNGIDDNVKITELVRAFREGEGNGELTIYVNGTFGAAAPYRGNGDTSTPFIWFEIPDYSISDRRVTLDFANCVGVNLEQNEAGRYYIFSGTQFTVKNLNLTVVGKESELFGGGTFWGNKRAYFEKCKIFADVGSGALFSFGDFRDCEFTAQFAVDDGAIFRPYMSNDAMRIDGGVYCCYNTDPSKIAAVIHCGSDISSAVIIANGIDCPTIANTGYTQKYAVYDKSTTDMHIYRDVITTLTVDATKQTTKNIIAKNNVV